MSWYAALGALEQGLATCFELSETETRELAELADSEAAESVSLHQFTNSFVGFIVCASLMLFNVTIHQQDEGDQ